MSGVFVKLVLKAENDGEIPKSNGILIKGMFYDFIQKQDSGLADRLRKDQIKLFSLTKLFKMEFPDLLGEEDEEKPSLSDIVAQMDGQAVHVSQPAKLTEKQEKRKLKSIQFKTGDLFVLHIATADQELIGCLEGLTQYRWQADRGNFDLSFVEAERKSFVMDQMLSNPITLDFKTPVSFSQDISTFVWPEPAKIVDYLLLLWNAWLPNSQIDTQYLAPYIAELQVISAKGRVVSRPYYDNTPFSGWIGKVTIYIKNRELRKILSMLFLFGEYSGVGRGRTVGFGRYRIYKGK